jgi:hypothetical protein
MLPQQHLQKLLQCIDLEEKEQAEKYKLDQAHTLKQLKAEGLATCLKMAPLLNVLLPVKNQ